MGFLDRLKKRENTQYQKNVPVISKDLHIKLY